MKFLPETQWRPKLVTGVAAWLGVFAVAIACLGPAWSDWTGTVVGPFGGIDAMLQAGLVQWSAHTWLYPQTWENLPIFFPLEGSIGFMDSLLGQAWLVWPLTIFFEPTAAALYNWSFLGSLLLAALGMAALFRASGGRLWSSGIAALFLLGSPYTASQLGHLNQLPPPFVLFSLAALIAGLRRYDAGLPATIWWWLLGLFMVLQAAWGWYGFAYTIIGVAVIKTTWLVHRSRRRDAGLSLVWTMIRQALPPSILAVVGVLILAQPQLQLADRYDSFTRTETEVRLGSADYQHLWNRGVYRSGPQDWVGKGKTGFDRYDGQPRQVLNPGWLAIGLGAIGWWRRGYLSFQRRRVGRAMLIVGLVGLVLAFGDSVGLPFTDRRLSLPLEWLRELAPPFKAFRGAWRFSWLVSIGLAWWSAVAIEQMVEKTGHRQVRPWIPFFLVLLVTLVSIPVAVPGLKLQIAGLPTQTLTHSRPSVLTLPAPVNEFAEDVAEARWLLRAIETGQRVTGGATGWVPPEVAALRARLFACENGVEDPHQLFREMKERGVSKVELTLRSSEIDESQRLDFWRQTLIEFGARRQDNLPSPLYESYLLP